MNAKLSVFDFQDYRSFMKAHFETSKTKNSSWSYEAWAQRLGLKNNTSLLKIIKGQREAGPRILHLLEQHFSLRGRELEYFRALVALSKSKTVPEARSTWLLKLAELHPKKAYLQLDDATFAMLSKWHGYAVRQITRLKDFREDPEWISRQFLFKLTPREVSATIETLLRLGLVTRNGETGSLSAVSRPLNSMDDIASEALKRYHESVLENAREALRKVPPRDRQISGLTLAIRASEIDEAKHFIREFEDRFLERFGAKEGADAVYQAEIAFFPITRPSGDRSALLPQPNQKQHTFDRKEIL